MLSENIIREVLNDANCNTVEATKSNQTKVLAQIQRFQERIRKHIVDNYVDFLPNRTSAELYLEQGETLVRSAEHLLNITGKDTSMALIEANTELQKLTDSLNEAYLGLCVSCRILQIDNLFQALDEAVAAKELGLTKTLLEQLKSLIFNEDYNSDVEQTFQSCACYETIKIKYHIQTNFLQQNLQQRFEQLVQFSEKPFPQAKCVTIQVSKETAQLQEITTALFQLRYNRTRISTFLMEQCFEPLILKPVSLNYNTEHDVYLQLSLSYSTKPLSNNLRPNYKHVFEHINNVLDCLSSLNVSVDDKQHVFTIIGDHIKSRLLTMLVDECLMHDIPTTIEEYKQSKMVEDVLNFEQMLADCFFIQLDNKSDCLLSQFAEHFDIYFRNNFNRELLQAANKIMQKDLQDMTLVSEKHAAEDVANKPLLFPRCMVSKSVIELHKLLERIVRQANETATNTDDELVDNFDTIAVILNTYAMQVPKLHEKLLESIPQQSALFYNNCMFLAYWVAMHAGENISCLAALVKMLQSTGTKHLNVQIVYQQKIIVNILKDFDLSDAHSIGNTPIKLIRQCLRQMELLRNVWQNVLPESIYNKTFCQLLHDFCDNIIKRIQALEDISATVANELSELIVVILQKAPTLFKENHEVVHIKSWQKMEQLKLILNASLLEIVEQWCEGAGPLTANYTADEVRHFIRALFQNTDRRANALAKIC